jgi:pyridoxamine 5'-phosphate oxidase
MEMKELLETTERILDTARVGLLTTVDNDGQPWVRWMTPKFLRGEPGRLYAITAEGFRKVDHIRNNRNVGWMIQNNTMDEVIHITGKAMIVDNPTLKADVLEGIGGYLGNFWRLNTDALELVVIETLIQEIDYYDPMKGNRASSALLHR